MLVRFADLGRVLQVGGARLDSTRVQHFWSLVAQDQWASAVQELTALDARLHFVVSPSTDQGSGGVALKKVALVATELGVVPLAQAVVLGAPASVCAQVGRTPKSHGESLALVLGATGVDLSSSRLRVGFTRGHLLEVVLLVPGEVNAALGDLQVAAELYLEEAIGDRVLDTWVGNILVDRVARSSSLLVLQNKPQGDSYPLSEAASLIHVGTSGLMLELPHTLLGAGASAHQWTALEIPELSVARKNEGAHLLQLDRRYASTCFPEALKSVLEGAPFSSGRFTRGSEVFCYLSWGANGLGAAERGRLRLRAEELLGNESLAAMSMLAGSGFGKARDYLDVWVVPETPILERLIREVSAVVGPVTFGFYDAIWSEEVLEFSPGQ